MPAKQVNIYAHRGGPRWAPQNTLAAFKQSLAAGVYGVELDIQRCKSGELVVFHDADVRFLTNGTGLIKDLTLTQLQALDAGFKFGQQFQGERIPLLDDVLKLVNGQLVINIEIVNTPFQYPGIEDELVKVLASYAHRDQLIISSFDHELLARLHAKAPDLRLAILIQGIMRDLGPYMAQIGATVWHPFFGAIRADSVADAHRAGLPVNVWTVNSPLEWTLVLSMGVDGIITDDPVGLSQFLKQQASQP